MTMHFLVCGNLLWSTTDTLCLLLAIPTLIVNVVVIMFNNCVSVAIVLLHILRSL